MMRKIKVYCGTHRYVYLSDDEYMHQLKMENNTWHCPKCYSAVRWVGIFYACRVDGCGGWVNSETDDTCDKCGKNAYELYCEQEEAQGGEE